ncbi:molybdenum cofactor biosynthesis protein C [Lyngbya sp. PCC 8106]|nr:molybdenum cofactor biosynthesis protein C [Lyngbya sp. PCC 8106]
MGQLPEQGFNNSTIKTLIQTQPNSSDILLANLAINLKI